MKINKIGFIDSGLGGLTVLKNVKKKYPHEKYLYYADNLNNPYGLKTKEELLNITKRNIDYLINNNCNIIVLACGTISSNIYTELCYLYPDIKFIKALTNIESKLINNKQVLFMATRRTCESNYLQTLANNNTNLNVLSCDDLATLIELGDEQKLDDYLKKLLIPYQNIQYDTIILGCTHYPLVYNKIKKYLTFKHLVTPSIDVIKELSLILNQTKDNGSIDIYNSKQDENYTKRCYQILKD